MKINFHPPGIKPLNFEEYCMTKGIAGKVKDDFKKSMKKEPIVALEFHWNELYILFLTDTLKQGKLL